MIFTYSLLQKLNKPGLWFVCSEHPASELKQYIYDFAVESGLPIVVFLFYPLILLHFFLGQYLHFPQFCCIPHADG